MGRVSWQKRHLASTTSVPELVGLSMRWGFALGYAASRWQLAQNAVAENGVPPEVPPLRFG